MNPEEIPFPPHAAPIAHTYAAGFAAGEASGRAETLPVELDTGDLEAMQRIINTAAHTLGERILHLEHELRGMTETAQAKQAFHEKQGFRYRALQDFADWVIANAEDGIPAQQLVSRARKARTAWPEEQEISQ